MLQQQNKARETAPPPPPPPLLFIILVRGGSRLVDYPKAVQYTNTVELRRYLTQHVMIGLA